MTYLGDFRVGKTVRFWWNSNAIAGESITRATNGTISVYKDASDTQSTTGVTDGEDSDGLTGVHRGAIDLSADGTFYSGGSDFAIVLSGATIDGKTINAVLAQFSIENRSAIMPTTADRKLDVSAGGEAGVDWANVGSPTTTLNLSGTTIKTATDVAAKTDNLPSDPADQSLIIAATDALATLIADVPTNAELATALGTADDAVLAQVALVKAKTDSLTFTVAGQVDANIQSVNDVEVTGDGGPGTEWGPV